jgi:hypothetical protein
MLDRRGTRWQPDIAYVVLDSGKFSTQPAEEVPSSNQALYLASVIREDVLIVHSSVQRGAVGFLSGLNLKVDAALEARLKRVFAASREKWLSCSFDYVVLISAMFPFTGVIEMNGKSENSGLKLAYRESGANPKALVVQLAQHVADALRGMSDRPQVPTIYFYSEATD